MNNFDYSQEMYEDVANYYDHSMAEEKCFYWTPSTIFGGIQDRQCGAVDHHFGDRCSSVCWGPRATDVGTASPQDPRPPRPIRY